MTTEYGPPAWDNWMEAERQQTKPITIIPGSLADRWIRESRIVGSFFSPAMDEKGGKESKDYAIFGDPGRVLGVKVWSVKKTGWHDIRNNPVYEIVYTTTDKNGNVSGTRTAQVSELPKDQQKPGGGPPNTRFVHTLDLAPKPQSVTTGSNANPPSATLPEVQDKEWETTIRLAMEGGTPEASARALAKLARSVGITDAAWANTAGLIGPAVAKLFERNPTTVKRLFESEGLSIPTKDQTVVTTEGEDEDAFDPNAAMADIINNLIDAFSKGGGGARRIYQPPDRREVEDMVRGMLARTIGLPVEGDVQNLTDLYMREDRRAFDNPSGGISAQASVLARIHGRSDYKQIHSLRPDLEDEMEWVNKRYQGVQEGGLTGETAIEAALEQATVGATQESAAEAGSNELITEGQLSSNFRDRFTAIGRAMGSRLA